MTRDYFYAVAICGVAYFAPQFLNNFDNEVFYVVNSSFSLFVIFGLLLLKANPVILFICVIELMAIFLNLLAGIGYVGRSNIFYDQYDTILTTLNTLELAALLWKPLDGIILRCKRLFKPVRLDDCGYKLCHNRHIQSS